MSVATQPATAAELLEVIYDRRQESWPVNEEAAAHRLIIEHGLDLARAGYLLQWTIGHPIWSGKVSTAQDLLRRFASLEKAFAEAQHAVATAEARRYQPPSDGGVRRPDAWITTAPEMAPSVERRIASLAEKIAEAERGGLKGPALARAVLGWKTGTDDR